MAWVSRRPANEPLAGLFIGPLMGNGPVLCLFITGPLTLLEIPLGLIILIEGL